MSGTMLRGESAKAESAPATYPACIVCDGEGCEFCPGSFLARALAQLVAGRPDAAIEMGDGIYLRAEIIVQSLLPDALLNIEAQKRSAVVERIGPYSAPTTPAVCASHLSVTGLGAVNGQTVAAGGTTAINIGVSIVADATLPSTCASGTFSIAWSGSTS